MRILQTVAGIADERIKPEWSTALYDVKRASWSLRESNLTLVSSDISAGALDVELSA